MPRDTPTQSPYLSLRGYSVGTVCDQFPQSGQAHADLPVLFGGIHHIRGTAFGSPFSVNSLPHLRHSQFLPGNRLRPSERGVSLPLGAAAGVLVAPCAFFCCLRRHHKNPTTPAATQPTTVSMPEQYRNCRTLFGSADPLPPTPMPLYIPGLRFVDKESGGHGGNSRPVPKKQGGNRGTQQAGQGRGGVPVGQADPSSAASKAPCRGTYGQGTRVGSHVLLLCDLSGLVVRGLGVVTGQQRCATQ